MAGQFNIEVEFLGGLTASQEDIFAEAAARWSDVISADVPSMNVDGVEIDDLKITAQGLHIDGVGGVLGRAGPRAVRPGSLIPATGIMEFDTADLRSMELNGSLLSVIIHEMGHVLGIGTLWSSFGLIEGSGSADPVFVGDAAMLEFGNLLGSNPRPVPVENEGGSGSREGHWRDSVFGNELMTSFLSAGINPMSRLTIASLEDLGYTVDFAAAEAFSLPSPLEMAIMGIGAKPNPQCCCMCSSSDQGSGIRILSEDDIVKTKKKSATRTKSDRAKARLRKR